MDIVLPLSVKVRRGENSDLLRLQTLLRSADAFWNGGGTLCIVTPDHDAVFDEVAKIDPQRTRVAIYTDDEVFGSLRVKMRYWHRQQVLKLAAHQIVESNFYLVLDADCFFVRSTAESDLVVDGRGRVSFGRGPAYSQGKWYAGCQKLGLRRPDAAVNVTPFVMHRRLAADALEFVASRVNSITKFGWSEYALYHCVATKNGTWSDHHFEGAPLLGNEVWHRRSLSTWDAAKCFAPGDFPLSLVQSATRAPARWVWSRVQEFIDKAASER